MDPIDHTPDVKTARLAGTALALASLLAIAGFTVLGSVFEYPQILKEPTSDILALFREHQGSVMTWFLVLVVSAVLMAPAGIWLGRIAGGTLGKWITHRCDTCHGRRVCGRCNGSGQVKGASGGRRR